MGRGPVFIEGGQQAPRQEPTEPTDQPPAEEDLGGGDICSVEETPSADGE